jgi:death-on-curing protein
VTVWLTRQLILAIHDEQLAEHGGSVGVRDEGLLESALARPLNRAGYGEPDLAELAAVYALGDRAQPSVRRWQQAHRIAFGRSWP